MGLCILMANGEAIADNIGIGVFSGVCFFLDEAVGALRL